MASTDWVLYVALFAIVTLALADAGELDTLVSEMFDIIDVYF